jgi:HEAT repeat protein
VVWHGAGVTDHGAELEAVIRHAVELADDDDDIEPTLTALAASGDITLVPRLREALDRFLDERNFYGRDLIAGVLAGIEQVAALPVLLRAAARDLGDDQDGLQQEIIELLYAHRAASRPAVLACATDATPELRRVGLWALGFLAEAPDVDLLAAALTDPDAKVRAAATGSIPDPADNDRAFEALLAALRDPDERVRAAAASSLGGTGRADAVAPLVALAGDEIPRVRAVAAYALGSLRRDEAAPALRRLLRDPDRQVRDRASDALGAVGGRP